MLCERVIARTIYDNPKAGQAASIRLGERDGIITKSWRRRLEAFFRVLIPAHVADKQVVWLHTPEEIDAFYKRLLSDEPALDDVAYVCIMDSVADLYDVVDFFSRLGQHLPAHAKVIYTTYNWFWAPLFRIGGLIGLSRNRQMGSFFRERDLDCFLEMAGWENTRKIRKYATPVPIPVLSLFIDNIVLSLPGVRRLAMNTVFIARRQGDDVAQDYSVTVIIPCKNEEHNIAATCQRMPQFGRSVELVFVDDQSTDGTRAEVERCQEEIDAVDIKLVVGEGQGKGAAVRRGMTAATGDICMILDADLTVIPEDLTQFYHGMRRRVADFIHGTRLVYPHETGAMRFANVLGNVGFSLLFSFILEQRTTDTLCGTKVFWRRDWPCFEEMRHQLKHSDRWGDYNLIFGAARYGLKIGELPVRYFERLEGATKMTKRVKNGLIMLRVAWHAIWKLKFWF